jgi:hypothetical protein
MPNFSQNYYSHDDDCNIVWTGTSITQGGGYTPTRSNASTLPIFCDQYDLPGRMWEDLSVGWQGQQYRRYDSGYFTKTGTWATKSTDAAWDDTDKDPWVDAATSASASLQFVIPDSAWVARFLYKSEAAGDNCTISIAEGNGKLQVQDTVGAWVEANGYVFSTYQAHSGTTSYDDGYGNTIFGKRLRFQARNLAGSFNQLTGDKTVTITKSSNTSKRMSYWGVEWSRAPHMLSVINTGRAGNAYDKQSTPTKGSALTARTDIMYFEPDLIMCEISHNRYGSTPDVTIPLILKFYLNKLPGGASALEKLSLDSLTNHFDTIDIVFYNPSIGIGNFTLDGEMVGSYYSGRLWSQADNRDYVANWFRQNYPSYIFADCHSALREAAVKFYGSYKAGVVASSNGGLTLYRDINHPNKRGYAVMWKTFVNLF